MRTTPTQQFIQSNRAFTPDYLRWLFSNDPAALKSVPNVTFQMRPYNNIYTTSGLMGIAQRFRITNTTFNQPLWVRYTVDPFESRGPRVYFQGYGAVDGWLTQRYFSYSFEKYQSYVV